jgi:hypothetical protein
MNLNPVDGEQKICQLKNLILILLGLIFRCTVYIYNIRLLMVNIEFIWKGLGTWREMSFSESILPFRAESNKFYIHYQWTNIVFILQSKAFLEIILTHKCISF